MKVEKTVLLAVGLCAIVLVGELFTVLPNVHTYDSNAVWNDGYVDYSVTTNGSEVYDAILTDNGTFKPADHLKIYAGNYTDSSEVTNKETYNDIVKSLKARGFTDVSPCNDSGLEEYIKNPSKVVGYGLLVITKALPSTVYDTNDTNPLLSWIGGGGSLYWFDSMAGRYCKVNGTLTKVPNYQERLFGVNDCINTGIEKADTKIVDGGFTDAYSLKNSYIKNGLNYQKIADKGVKELHMGYSIDGYSTITMVQKGNGMICVFSNSFGTYGIDDIAQVIAGRINVHTTILEHQDGQVVRGTVNGHMNFTEERSHCNLYVYLGGTYTVYGRSYSG